MSDTVTNESTEFYEDDESAEAIRGIFARNKKGSTASIDTVAGSALRVPDDADGIIISGARLETNHLEVREPSVTVR